MNALLPRLLVLAACGLWSLACSKPKPEEGSDATQVTPVAAAPTPPAPPSPKSQAKQFYNTRCTACHGPSGQGDGPGAQALDPKPRNFADAAWQSAATDEQIAKIIKEGGPAVGKSPGMPSNPDLSGKDDVVVELVKLVRGFQG